MKYAILSDIHANLEALNAVLDVCDSLGVTHYMCLGDIVGYNADPAECVRIVRNLPNCTVVKGNHDEYVSNCDTVIYGFNEHARNAVLWTRKQLSEDDLVYLANLPLKQPVRAVGATMVHATLDSPGAWGYIFDPHHAADNFTYQTSALCFCGHSHSPLAFCKRPSLMSGGGRDIIELPQWAWADNENEAPADPTIKDQLLVELQIGCKYLFNVGSVGQPRNHDPRASFAILDTERREVSRLRIPYDIAAAQQKIREAGLPERLAERLVYGR